MRAELLAPALLALTSAAAPLPEIPTALARCESSIGLAETMARRVDDCARFLAAEHKKLADLKHAKPSTANRGLPDTRLWSIPADASSPEAREKLNLAVPDTLRPRLASQIAYAGFAEGSSAGCAKLSVVDLQGPCLADYGDLTMVRAAQGAPGDLLKACRIPQTHTPPSCCGLLARLKDRSNPCAEMVPGCWKDLGSCRAFWDGSVGGDASACGGLRVDVTPDCKADGCRAARAERIARCVEEAAYVRAFKARDVALCAGSPRCRVLMGEARAVTAELSDAHFRNPAGAWFLKNGWKPPPPPVETPEPPLPEPRDPASDYMGFVCADPLHSAANRKASSAPIDLARKCLDDVEAEIPNPSEALIRGLDERAEKLARLSVRLELAFTPTRLEVKDR